MSDERGDNRAITLQTVRRVTTGSTDIFRHVARSLPAPVRARLRDIAMWVDQVRPTPPIADWSKPLLAASIRSDASLDEVFGANEAIAGHDDLVEPVRSRDYPRGSDASLPTMRCLLVTSALDVGGLAGVVAFLARRLPTHRLQTAVLHARSDPSAPREPDRLARMLQSNGIEVYAADDSNAQGWIERWRPDVISAHHAPGWVLTVAQRVGVPYVDNLHGMHDLFGTDWRIEAARGAKLSAIVGVSELVCQQYLAGNREFPPNRIAAIPNGVDDERQPVRDRAAARDRLGLTDEYLFVSLARLCLQKNTYGLIAAFAELARRRPEAHLVLAGRPHEVRYYRRVLRLCDGLPCRDRIHLRDHVAAPAELLAAADGFVLDSFFEGWPLASMEALFAGVPVVLSDVGGAREQIGDDPARGYLVANPLGDPLSVDWESIGSALYRDQINRDEFATAMERLVAYRGDYLRDRERLAAESTRRFSADVCLARHAAVLRAVAAGADLPANNAYSLNSNHNKSN